MGHTDHCARIYDLCIYDEFEDKILQMWLLLLACKKNDEFLTKPKNRKKRVQKGLLFMK